jgi:hypothetical protein
MQVVENYGGLEMTRTSDLFRVKEGMLSNLRLLSLILLYLRESWL